MPKPSRSAASKIVRDRRQRSKPKNVSSKALKAIQNINEISLPDGVQERYLECQEDPSKFWVWAGFQLDLDSNSIKSIETFLIEAYAGLTHLESQRQWDTIQWRFFVIFFYDLAKSFGGTYIKPAIEEEIMTILSSSATFHTPEKIRGNLKRWVSCGLRYANLSVSLCDGAPFLLPQAITDKT